MPLKPYKTIDEMLKDLRKARVLADDHPAQKNAITNRFNYKIHTGPENKTLVIKEFDED